MSKVTLRERMRKLRAKVGAKRRSEVSHALCERLLKRTLGMKLVCCYEALKTEIDLAEFISKFKGEIVFPEKVGDEYQVPRASEVDYWICPGLAFSPHGDRIGFGGGWYDRFLGQAKPTAKSCGVAYRFQLLDGLPVEVHDRRLDEIFCEGVSLDWEKELGDPVAGVDEAGRGPLVGGVYAAAVSVPLARAEELLWGEWRGINDSKQLSERKREELAEVIKATEGCRWAIASASAQEIDELNILKATHLAMRRAVAGLASSGGVRGSVEDEALPNVRVLVDGLPVKTLPGSTNLIKGDARSLLIAAASILAKTARDADCLRLERLYPGYGIAQHKGYPTREHCEALAKLGPCPEHRKSFGPVKSILNHQTIKL